MDSIIDVNVNLSRWPTRRLREDETHLLVKKLQTRGVVEAWAGSFDGLLHKDIAAVNARLAEECRTHTDIRLRPFGSINLQLPDWEEDLRRCVEVHRMPGIRLHPNYHGYKLDDPVVARLAKMARDYGLLVAVVVQMEDERIMHPLLHVRPVSLEPLGELLSTTAGLRLLILNSGRALVGNVLARLVRAGEVYVDIAHIDGLGGLEEALKDIPMERLLFGSHAPYFYFESAELKFQESELPGTAVQAILFQNAARLIRR